MHLNLHTILPILTLLLAIFCGLFVITQNPKAFLNQTFFTLCICIIFWFSIYIPFNFNLQKSHLLIWFKIAYFFISFVPITCFTFVSTYLKMPGNQLWFKINTIIGLSFSILSISTDWIVSGINYYPWYPFPQGGILHPLLILHCITLNFLSLKFLFKKLNDPLLSSRNRNHIKYMFAALAAGSFSMIDFLANYKISFYSVGYIPVAAYLIITTTCIIKHQLMDIQIVIRKSLIYSLLVAAITIIFLIAVMISEQFFSQAIHGHHVSTSMITAILIAILFTPLKNKIQDIVDRSFFHATPLEMSRQNEQFRNEIADTERMKSIAILASGLAHEIKNPLTPIKTFSEQLPSRLDDKKFLLKFSKIIGKEVDRIDSLVQELLAFAKPSSSQLNKTNIHHLILQTTELLNNEIIRHKIILKNSFEDQNLLINIDFKRIKQAILNIILNAIDAMPNGGTLTISTKMITQDINKFLLIEIADTGHGIAPKDLPHIFDPFFSRKDHGTGLGLSITHEIIKNHNGTIFAESILGRGTTFKITLPI